MLWNRLPQLAKIINAPLLIGETLDDLDAELQNNTCYISMCLDERKAVTQNELMGFFERVIKSRGEQIAYATANHGMWFYVWHDHQASQLRFSLISDFHETLPFRVIRVRTELSKIVQDFLTAADLIPWETLEITDWMPETSEEADDEVDFVIEVYQQHLPKSV